MSNDLIMPMGTLAVWTLLVLLLVPITRIRAVQARRVKGSAFRFGESADVPGDVSLPNRAYMNLLELPVLFYAAALCAMATGRADAWTVRLAWAFVGLRIVHTLIHLTYNNVLHRLLAFALGVTVILALWLKLLAGL